MSSLMAKIILMTLRSWAGAPVVVGGGENLVNAFASLIRALGGEVHVGAGRRADPVKGQACLRGENRRWS